MKKFKLFNWFNISLALFATLTAGIIFGIATLNNLKQVKADEYLNPSVANVSFKVGEVDRLADGYNSTTNTFDYLDENDGYITSDLSLNISDGQFHMLRNYNAEQALKSSIGVQNVKNIYIAFGTPYDIAMQQGTNYGDNGVLISSLSVTAKLNGQDIKVNNTITDTAETVLPGGGNLIDFEYWYNYFDLTNVVDLLTEQPVENNEGEYSFTFRYTYVVKNGNAYQIVGPYTYTFTFYLIDEKTYIDYPELNNAVVGEKEDVTNIEQFFYNFQTQQLPTLTFDANLYNISYSVTQDDNSNVENVTSTIVKNLDGSITLTFNSSISGNSQPITIYAINGKYNYTLEFSELGSYNILVRYIVHTPSGAITIGHEQANGGIPTYDFTRLVSHEGQSVNPYTTGLLAKNYKKLHIFGIKSYFTKHGQPVHLNSGIYNADFTARMLANGININTSAGLYAELLENGSGNFALPTTNLPPVTFTSYGTYQYNGFQSQSIAYRYLGGFDSNPSQIYVTKNTEISQAGYYEVIFTYTFSKYNVGGGNSNTVHHQVFVFKIDNVTPPINLVAQDEELNKTTLQSSQYTNKDVFIEWNTPNPFEAEIRAVVTRTNYQGQGAVQTTYNNLNLLVDSVNGKTYTPLLTQNGRYVVRIYFSESENLHIEHTFIIDKNGISNINFMPIEAMYSSTNTITSYSIVSNPSVVDIAGKSTINQPFTLTYSPKESGANIITTYQKIPFTTYLNGGQSINGDTHVDYVKTNFAVNHSAITSSLEYVFNYNTLTTGIVNTANSFIDSSSFIYLFTIHDEAGNTANRFIIYDLTKPELIIEPEINNPYNIVSNDTNIYWGNYKAIPFASNMGPSTNQLFRSVVENNPNLFVNVNGSYYLVSEIDQVTFTIRGQENSPYIFTKGQPSYSTGVTLYAQTPSSPTSQQIFFSGEKVYMITAKDKSNITSNTSIAKSNVFRTSIDMNFDNAMAMVYGLNFNAQYNSSTIQTQYGQALFFNSVTNADQIRVSYKPGDIGTDYYVKSFTYTYYEYAPQNYTNITVGSQSSHTYESGEPRALYPFNATPTVVNEPVTISNLLIQTPSGTDNTTVVSEVINYDLENGEIKTKPGMYVFRREYESGENLGNDKKVRFYIVYVDREKNINIKGDAFDEDITLISNPDSDSILYNTGSGIYFKFTKNISDTTRYSAKQIQQYVTQTGLFNLFESNKLPVRFNIPYDKYNSAFVLSKAVDAVNPNAQDYINTVKTNYNDNTSTPFPIHYKIINLDGTTTLVADTKTNYYNSLYSTIEYNSTLRTYQLSVNKKGTYQVIIYTNPSAERDIQNTTHPETQFTFEFTILHESPNGNYYSKYADGSDMLLNQKGAATNTLVTFQSTNNAELKFVFSDNPDVYKAKIDTQNIIIRRNGSVIYSRINGNESTTGGITGVFSQEEISQGINRYTLTLSDFTNQTAFKDMATYEVQLSFVGTASDYQVQNIISEFPLVTETVSYFTRTFRIVVDRIKPQHNYNNLLLQDAQKYNAQTSLNGNLSNYFFAVNKDFWFVQNPALQSELDSTRLYVRPLEIDSTTLYPVSYYQTITPDDPNYSNSAILPNNPRFSESDSKYEFYREYMLIDNEWKLSAETLFEVLVSNYETNYFEVIERDEAGNYRVYAVQYVNTSITPEIEVTHRALGEQQDTETKINDTNKNVSLKGNNLQFVNITSTDYFAKVIVSYAGTNTTFINNPNDNLVKNSFTNLITNVQNHINNLTQNINPNGYNITITFVNRFDDNFTLNYLVPGQRQQPVFTNINSTTFTIKIPADLDGGSTRIEQFAAYKLENNVWRQLTEDAIATPIRPGAQGGPSLQNQTYTFGVGEYKFKLIDNFGRGAIESEFPPFYYGLGVNDVRQITYPNSQVYNGITYTAGTVTLRYQTNLYELQVYKYVEVDGVLEMQLLDNPKEDDPINIAESIDNATAIKTMTFQNPVQETEQRYFVRLLLNRTAQVFEYDFIIYKKLPQIVLTTLEGSYLNPASSPFTQNILITWSDTPLDFSPSVTLRRTYVDSNGIPRTETISNIRNGYQISEVGTYEAVITNALKHTNTSKNLTFQLVSGSVVVFDVVAVANGLETVLQPSPVRDIIVINGQDKVVHKYYALKRFNGNTPGHSIEIRLNTQKALEAEEITSLNPETKLYRIFGTQDYGYERYIEIVFVDLSSNFINLNITQPTFTEDGQESDPEFVTISQTIKSAANRLTLTWNAFNPVTYITNEIDNGNIISADYYYNGVLVKTITNINSSVNTLVLENAGVHKLRFRDTAGNIQLFNTYSELTINLVNNLTFLINDEEPIKNYIANDLVKLTITNRALYDSDPVVTAKLDGKDITVTRTSTTGYNYEFTQQGYYEVTLKTVVRINGVDTQIETKYNFIIINSKQKLLAFNLPHNYNFEVVNFVKDEVDITHELLDKNELWISQASTGVGQYIVTVRTYLSTLETYRYFTFTLSIYDEIPEITASIEFGTSTTNNIEVYYNEFRIFESLGESILRISRGSQFQDIAITEEGLNERKTLTITNPGIYYIELLTKDGKLVTSYRLEKTEPLNTTAIIVITIASLVTVGLGVTFFILRRRIKFR